LTAPRKQHFIEELKQLYSEAIASARQAETRAAEASDDIQREARRKEDAKGAVEAGRLAVGHRRRRQRATRELETLIAFAAGGVRDFRRSDAVGIGAFVDVTVYSEEGTEERTLFVLPVGAGRELLGPGGEGFVHVVTPASPVGQALLGAHIGDTVEVIIDGRDKEWELLDLA
jgi:transcription elongation GreA/GreB family factor